MSRYPMKRQAGQTVDEMAEQLVESASGNRLNSYPEQSAAVRQQALANAIGQQRELLRTTKKRGRRIDLDDLNEVEQTADAYMAACVKAGVFPTFLGFAAATGWSRMSLYRYINAHPATESARYLDNLRSSWAAIMAQMGLSRLASEAVSIFLLKNSGQDLTDRHEVTALSPGMAYDETQEPSVNDIMARYITEDTDESPD